MTTTPCRRQRKEQQRQRKPWKYRVALRIQLAKIKYDKHVITKEKGKKGMKKGKKKRRKGNSSCKLVKNRRELMKGTHAFLQKSKYDKHVRTKEEEEREKGRKREEKGTRANP